MTAELAVQKALRARLISTPGVVALVPAASILDRNEQPVPEPSVIIGEATARDDGDSISRTRTTVFADVHVWKKEPSTAGVKAITGAVRTALRNRLAAIDGYHFVDCFVSSTRFLRDPDGKTSHGIATVTAIVEEQL